MKRMQIEARRFSEEGIAAEEFGGRRLDGQKLKSPHCKNGETVEEAMN